MSLEDFPKAWASLVRHWSQDQSRIETERSNTCAERAVKAIENMQTVNLKRRKSKLAFYFEEHIVVCYKLL